MSRGKNAVRWAVLLFFLAACLYIAWKVPYTHDDWDWGLPIGWERFWSSSLNSRYSGTALVLMMTRSQLAKILVMGGCMFAIPFLAARLAAPEQRRTSLFLTAAAGAALFSMPMVSWRQTFGWVSAFANFVAGAAVMLGVLLLWQRTFSREKKPHPMWLGVGLFLGCLIGSLFAENITPVLAGAGLVTAGYALITRWGRLPALAGLAGCLLGALLMFGNPLYGQLVSNGAALEGIRTMAFAPGTGLAGIVAVMWERFFTLLLPGLFESYPGVCLLASVGCLWRLHRGGVRWYWQALVGLWSAIYCAQCWVVMEQLRQLDSWQCPWQPVRVAGAVIQLILLLAVVIWDGGKKRNARLLLLAAAVGMLLPFAVVTEYGTRCVFPSAVALLVAGLSLLHGLEKVRWVYALALIALVFSVGFHLRAYRLIGQTEWIRQTQMTQAVAEGASSVVLPTEGWDLCYSWCRNPQSQVRADYFRAFYGLPEDMELIFLPPGSAEQWPQISEQMLQAAQRFS